MKTKYRRIKVQLLFFAYMKAAFDTMTHDLEMIGGY